MATKKPSNNSPWDRRLKRPILTSPLILQGGQYSLAPLSWARNKFTVGPGKLSRGNGYTCNSVKNEDLDVKFVLSAFLDL